MLFSAQFISIKGMTMCKTCLKLLVIGWSAKLLLHVFSHLHSPCVTVTSHIPYSCYQHNKENNPMVAMQDKDTWFNTTNGTNAVFTETRQTSEPHKGFYLYNMSCYSKKYLCSIPLREGD